MENLCFVILPMGQLQVKAMLYWTVKSSHKDGATLFMIVGGEHRVSLTKANVCYTGDVSMDRYVTLCNYTSTT